MQLLLYPLWRVIWGRCDEKHSERLCKKGLAFKQVKLAPMVALGRPYLQTLSLFGYRVIADVISKMGQTGMGWAPNQMWLMSLLKAEQCGSFLVVQWDWALPLLWCWLNSWPRHGQKKKKKKVELWTQTHIGRSPCEDECRDPEKHSFWHKLLMSSTWPWQWADPTLSS